MTACPGPDPQWLHRPSLLRWTLSAMLVPAGRTVGGALSGRGISAAPRKKSAFIFLSARGARMILRDLETGFSVCVNPSCPGLRHGLMSGPRLRNLRNPFNPRARQQLQDRRASSADDLLQVLVFSDLSRRTPIAWAHSLKMECRLILSR
jgi:hypothetical protein